MAFVTPTPEQIAEAYASAWDRELGLREFVHWATNQPLTVVHPVPIDQLTCTRCRECLNCQWAFEDYNVLGRCLATE